MAPQKLLECLKNLQSASNTLTLTMAATAHSIGEYMEFLCSEEDMYEAAQYVNKFVACLTASSKAMVAYCDAANALNALSREDMQYE